MAARYLGSVWNQTVGIVSGADALEMWHMFDGDLREMGADGTITLWARSSYGTRFSPIVLRPIA